MKQFNLEDALAGKPVVTRDGRKVIEIVAFKDRTIRQENGKYYFGNNAAETEEDAATGARYVTGGGNRTKHVKTVAVTFEE